MRISLFLFSALVASLPLALHADELVEQCRVRTGENIVARPLKNPEHRSNGQTIDSSGRPLFPPPYVIGPAPYPKPSLYFSFQKTDPSVVLNPKAVAHRAYPRAIAPHYIQKSTGVPGTWKRYYRETIMQGDLWTTDPCLEHMRYFTHYTISMDRIHNRGVVSLELTVLPQYICQDRDAGCGNIIRDTPPASHLIVKKKQIHESGIATLVLVSSNPFDPIQKMELTDYTGFKGELKEGKYPELWASGIVHYDGYREADLQGNRLFAARQDGSDY